MSDDFRSRLRKLDAVSSLVTERRVADRLRVLGWNAVHGFFYRDDESGKHREVDVAATLYRGSTDDAPDDEFRLTIVVECKSATESNIVVAPYSAPAVVPPEVDLTPVISTNDRIIEKVRSDLRDEVAEHFPVPDAIEAYNALWRRYNEFWNSLESEGVSVAPPPAPLVTTTYREISGIKEKDTDNSVVWRAFQGVYSAITALESEFVLYASAQVSQTFHQIWGRERNIYNALSAAVSCGVGLSQQYHPVIVTNAKLWMLEDDELREVPQFRFLQVDSIGLPFRWIDVVNASEFDAFAGAVTGYYESRLEMWDSERARVTMAQRLYGFLTEGR